MTLDRQRRILDDGAVYVEADRIVQVGPTSELRGRHTGAEVLDCSGRVLIPGLINTHTHLFQTLLKGLGDDMALHDWFVRMTGPGAVRLTADDVRAATLHGCAESLASGVTTLVEFIYTHPHEGLTDVAVQACHDIGIRAIVARSYLTTGAEYGVPAELLEDPAAALNDAARLIRRHNTEGARVQVGLAPCVIWSVEQETLEATRAIADEHRALITMHVAETDFEVRNAIDRFGRREPQFLGDVGLLGPDLLAVHAVHCQPDDIAVLAAHDVKVSHNPCSNMYLGSGIAPIPEMLAAGITVGLAADGPASNNNHNMIQSLKFAALSHKASHRDPTVITAEKVLELATIDAADAIGMADQVGSIEPGKKADLVTLRCDGWSVTPLHNPVSALVYSALGSEPETVMVDGRVVMRDRTLMTVDEQDVKVAARRAADGLVRRAGIDGLRRRWWPGTSPPPS